MPDDPPQLRRLADWDDGESVLVVRGKTRATGDDPYEPGAAAEAIADKLEELAEHCPADYFIKRIRVRRERLEKGRGYYLELAFSPKPQRKKNPCD
jgi:hypothetical protein